MDNSKSVPTNELSAAIELTANDDLKALLSGLDAIVKRSTEENNLNIALTVNISFTGDNIVNGYQQFGDVNTYHQNNSDSSAGIQNLGTATVSSCHSTSDSTQINQGTVDAVQKNNDVSIEADARGDVAQNLEKDT